MPIARAATAESHAAPDESAGAPKPKPRMVDVGGGLLIAEGASYCTVFRLLQGAADAWEQCTLFDVENRAHCDKFPAWGDPDPNGGRRGAADAWMTPARILSIWGAGTYRVTSHNATGLLGRTKPKELGAPGDARRDARAGVPEPAPAAAPEPPPPPPPARSPIPPGLDGMSGAQFFQLLSWFEDRTADRAERERAREEARHEREIERMRMRHQLDAQEADQRHRMMLEHQANTLNQAIALRRAPNPIAPPELLQRFDRLEQRLAEEDDTEEDDDRAPDESIAGQVERIAPIAFGVANMVLPLFRPQTSPAHGGPAFASPPAPPPHVPPIVVNPVPSPAPTTTTRHPMPRPRPRRVIDMLEPEPEPAPPAPPVDLEDDDDGPCETCGAAADEDCREGCTADAP